MVLEEDTGVLGLETQQWLDFYLLAYVFDSIRGIVMSQSPAAAENSLHVEWVTVLSFVQV